MLRSPHHGPCRVSSGNQHLCDRGGYPGQFPKQCLTALTAKPDTVSMQGSVEGTRLAGEVVISRYVRRHSIRQSMVYHAAYVILYQKALARPAWLHQRYPALARPQRVSRYQLHEVMRLMAQAGVSIPKPNALTARHHPRTSDRHEAGFRCRLIDSEG